MLEQLFTVFNVRKKEKLSPRKKWVGEEKRA